MPPELGGLVEGLERVLGVDEVRCWWGPLDAAPLSDLRDALGAEDIAVLAFQGLALRAAIDAVRDAGLDPAWSGLTRNGDDGIRRETALVVVAADRAEEVRTLLATGSLNLLFDPGAQDTAPLERPVRVCIASYEVVGPTKNGGIGTANTSLAEALAAAGHDVTLLYTGYQSLDDVVRDAWVGRYEQRGVRFEELRAGDSIEVDTPHFNHARAYQLYRWLEQHHREQPWDVIHVPECQGHGYYALLARRLGIAFDEATFVVGVHSPTRWVYEANRWVIGDVYRLVDDFLERRCVELADVVVSPSAYLLAWMEQHGWRLPERRFVQQYATSHAIARGSRDADGPSPEGEWALPEGPGTQAARDLGYQPPASPAREEPDGELEEIVFFGRLETRKGLETFCDALDLLAEDPDPPSFRVCFMGSETPIQGVPAAAYLHERSRRWPWSVRVETHRNQPEAVSYIRAPGRLVVMPSPVDNSPNTVLEGLGLGIPFVTSRGGGIPELIHPLDLDAATFEPTDARLRRVHAGNPSQLEAALSAEPLAEAIRRVTSGGEMPRPRFAVDPEANERVHVQWHERVAASGAARVPEATANATVSVCLAGSDHDEALARARRSFERQDLEGVELVLGVRDGEASVEGSAWRVEVGRHGELDAAAAGAASGEWLFLCDGATVAEPKLLSTVLRCAQVAGAEIVTCAAGYDEGRGAWHGDVPLGNAVAVGLVLDCFGRGGMLVSRQTFERLEGFEPDGPPALRRRDLLCRAALAGVPFTVVPEPLLRYDRALASEDALPPIETMLRTIRPYQRALSEAFADLPGLALSLAQSPPTSAPNGAREDYVRSLEERLETIVSSKSWRVTEPLRVAAERLRRRPD